MLAFLGSVVIGKVGTPAFSAISLALSLSPIEVITFELGPTQIRSAFSTSLENLAFSERNPYPGWIASAPVCFAASIISFPFRYVSLSLTASSAIFTKGE